MVKSTFARNLHRIRTHHGFTQAEAAAVIGINRGSLGSYEEGRAEPGIDVLGKICRGYGVVDVGALLWSPGFLVTKDSSENVMEPSLMEAKYHALKGDRKEAVNILLGLTRG